MFDFSEKFLNAIDFLTDTAYRSHGNNAQEAVDLVRRELRACMELLAKSKTGSCTEI